MEGQEQNEIEQEGSMVDEVLKTIIQMNKQRLEYERSGQFVNAGKIKDQLKKLGEEYVRLSLQEVRDKQEEEREGLEEEYEKQIDGLNQKWEAEFKKNDDEAGQQYQDIQQKQQTDMMETQERLKKDDQIKIKMTPEILNMEYQIAFLVKEQRYNEAAIVQRKMERQREQCIMKCQNNLDDALRNKLEALNKKHENEMMAIEKRINTNRDALIKAKDFEFEQLNSRFKVYREKLENNHLNVFLKEEKRVKGFNPCSNLLAYEE